MLFKVTEDPKGLLFMWIISLFAILDIKTEHLKIFKLNKKTITNLLHVNITSILMEHNYLFFNSSEKSTSVSQIPFLSGLISDSWILLCVSAFTLLPHHRSGHVVSGKLLRTSMKKANNKLLWKRFRLHGTLKTPSCIFHC